MSKIDEILTKFGAQWNASSFTGDPYQKKEIKAEALAQLATLINECLGGNEYPKNNEQNVNYKRTEKNKARDQLRAEIRTKLKQAGLPMEGK